MESVLGKKKKIKLKKAGVVYPSVVFSGAADEDLGVGFSSFRIISV